MGEQAGVASPEVDVFQGQNVSMAEYSQYRSTGELPERFKPAEPQEPAPAPESEGDEPASAGESETPKDQQEPSRGKLTAQQRIAQLESKIEELWEQEEPDTVRIAQLEATVDKIKERSGQKRKTEPAPVAQKPEPKAETQYTRPKPTADDKDKDGKPKYSNYEDFVEDLADWKAEQRQAKWEAEQAAREQNKAMQAKLDEGRSRYDDFDAVVQPALTAVIESQRVTPVVKALIADSDVSTDLLYALGTEGLSKLETLPPGKQIRYITALEAGVAEELAAPKTATPRDEAGKFAKAPEPKKTAAPKPPTPVNGASSRAFDVSDESLSPEEWMRQRNADLSRRR